MPAGICDHLLAPSGISVELLADAASCPTGIEQTHVLRQIGCEGTHLTTESIGRVLDARR